MKSVRVLNGIAKVGDKVRIVQRRECDDDTCGNVWTDGMGDDIGRTVTIEEIDTDGSVKVNIAPKYNYPPLSLALVVNDGKFPVPECELFDENGVSKGKCSPYVAIGPNEKGELVTRSQSSKCYGHWPVNTTFNIIPPKPKLHTLPNGDTYPLDVIYERLSAVEPVEGE